MAIGVLVAAVTVVGPIGGLRAPGGADRIGGDAGSGAAALGVVGVLGLRGLPIVGAVAEAGLVGTFAAVAPWVLLGLIAKTGLDYANDAIARDTADPDRGARSVAAVDDVLAAVAAQTASFAEARQRLRDALHQGTIDMDQYAAALRALTEAENLIGRPLSWTESVR